MLLRWHKFPLSQAVISGKMLLGDVLYVGKAKNLRARMRQYVQLSDERPMVPRLMAATDSFDYVVVGSEHEALVLERNLIAQYRPPFNVDLKDDKSYPIYRYHRVLMYSRPLNIRVSITGKVRATLALIPMREQHVRR